MARMKIEFLAQYRKSHGLSLRDRAVAYLPRYAARAAAVAPLSNLATRCFAGIAGFTTKRPLPEWRSNRFVDRPWPKSGEREVVLLVDLRAVDLHQQPWIAEKVLGQRSCGFSLANA